MEEDENHKELLDKHRVEIVSSLDLERQFIFSYLRSHSVFDDEDCERVVNEGTSRQQKASKFLDILALKGKEAIKHFIDALEYDHPSLYETLTGQQAVPPRVKPIPVYSGGQHGLSTRLADKELIDSDRQYLANQLERTTNDLQTMAYMHNKLVREKNQLEQKLMEANGDLDEKQRYLDEVKCELQSVTERASEQREFLTQNENSSCNHYVQELARDSLEKSNVIIMLQAKLLSANDEVEQFRRSNDEIRQKNENLMEHVKDLTINYDYQKRQSTRLNERVKLQTDEIKRVEDFRHQLYQLKFQIAQISEERDVAIRQLKEFRKVTEALNLRYDLVCHQKEQVLEEHETVSSQYGDMQGRFDFLGAKLKDALLEIGDWQRKNAKLKEEISTYREQRLGLLQERERAINERNSTLKERDDALRLNQEIQRSRDDAVTKQLEVSKKMEQSHKDAQNELDDSRYQIIALQSELADAYKALEVLEKKHEAIANDKVERKGKGNAGNRKKSDVDNDCLSKQTSSSATSRKKGESVRTLQGPWKKRSDLDILNSARRRILELNDDNVERRGFTLPNISAYQMKDTFGFDHNSLLMPLMQQYSAQIQKSSPVVSKGSSGKYRKTSTGEPSVTVTTSSVVETSSLETTTTETYDKRQLLGITKKTSKDDVQCGLSRKNAVRHSNKDRSMTEQNLPYMRSNVIDRFRSISLNGVNIPYSNDDTEGPLFTQSEPNSAACPEMGDISDEQLFEGYLQPSEDQLQTELFDTDNAIVESEYDDKISPQLITKTLSSDSETSDQSLLKDEGITKRKLSRLNCSRHVDGVASSVVTPTSPIPLSTNDLPSLMPKLEEESSTETKL